MNPLIAIAASVLPEILKSVIGSKSEGVADAIAKAVKDATGTAEPAKAQKKVEDDPAIAKELKIRLAEIAAEEEEKRRLAQLEAQKLQLQETENKRKADLEALKLQFEQDAQKRQAQFEDFQAGLKDTRAARSAFRELAAMGSPMAWGAPVVSVIVTTGFFLILVFIFVWADNLKAVNNPAVLQIINIAIGALTAAFATVVSFWLGSSQGSREKDAASFDLQAKQSEDTAEVFKKQAEHTETILKQRPGAPEPTPDEVVKPSNFRGCVDIVLAQEGGFVDHPSDPGGATNMGITFNTLKDWRGQSITVKDVKDLKVEEAREIYRSRYWNMLNCDNLPAGVDLVVFDFGVNAGPSRSAKLLQRVVGAAADGSIGPATLGAAKSAKPVDIVHRFSELRLEYYKSLRHWKTFGRGWTNRTNAVERAALAMIG